MSTKITITIILPEQVRAEDIRDTIRIALFKAPKKHEKIAKFLHKYMTTATIQIEPCKDEEEDE